MNTTLDRIREGSEYCSEHLHNTLNESAACKRNQDDSDADNADDPGYMIPREPYPAL